MSMKKVNRERMNDFQGDFIGMVMSATLNDRAQRYQDRSTAESTNAAKLANLQKNGLTAWLCP